MIKIENTAGGALSSERKYVCARFGEQLRAMLHAPGESRGALAGRAPRAQQLPRPHVTLFTPRRGLIDCSAHSNKLIATLSHRRAHAALNTSHRAHTSATPAGFRSASTGRV